MGDMNGEARCTMDSTTALAPNVLPQDFNNTWCAKPGTSNGRRAPPRGETPDFVRSTRNKLDADGARTALGQKDLRLTPITVSTDNYESSMSTKSEVTTGSFLQKKAFGNFHLAANTPSPTPRVLDTIAAVQGRHAMQSLISQDLDNNRRAFSEELRGCLEEIKSTLQQADVGALITRFLSEAEIMHAREARSQTECEGLRRHCEELLRLNAELRQRAFSRDIMVISNWVGQLGEQATEFRLLAGRIMENAERRESDDKALVEAISNNVKGFVASELAELRSDMGNTSTFSDAIKCELQPIKTTLEVLEAVQTATAESVDQLLDSRNQEADVLERLDTDLGSLQEKLKASATNPENYKEQMTAMLQIINDARAGSANEARASVAKKSVFMRKSMAASRKTNFTRGSDGLEAMDDASNQLPTVTRENSLGTMNVDRFFKELTTSVSGAVSTLDNRHTVRMRELGDRVNNLEKGMMLKLKGMHSDVAMAMDNTKSIIDQHKKVVQITETLSTGLEEISSTGEKKPMSIFEASMKLRKPATESVNRAQQAMQFKQTCNDLIEIERRGNVEIDLKTGEVKLVREIPFVQRKVTDDPKGEFADVEVARSVLGDLTKLWQMFQVSAVVEGHTKIGEGSFWQRLAESRAERIVEMLVKDFGIPRQKLIAKGLPGKKGTGVSGVKVKFDILSD